MLAAWEAFGQLQAGRAHRSAMVCVARPAIWGRPRTRCKRRRALTASSRTAPAPGRQKLSRCGSAVAWTVRVGQTLLDHYPARAVLGGQRGVPGQGRAKAHLADRQPTTSPTRIMGPGS